MSPTEISIVVKNMIPAVLLVSGAVLSLFLLWQNDKFLKERHNQQKRP